MTSELREKNGFLFKTLHELSKYLVNFEVMSHNTYSWPINLGGGQKRSNSRKSKCKLRALCGVLDLAEWLLRNISEM